jgi:inward rectifier potassium channel
MDGVPTVFVRIGNDREGAIIDARFRIAYVYTHTSREGQVHYRMTDLTLSRDRAPNLARSWTVMHPIDEASPLHGVTPTAFQEDESEILVTVVGTDGTSLQPVHGQRRYGAADILWGSRFADVLTELPDGNIQLDVRNFHHSVIAEGPEHFERA